MSNMFKSESRPRQTSSENRDRDRNKGNRNRDHIDFRGFNEKKKVEVKLTEADFPEFIEKDKVSEKEECKLNFKDAYLKEAVEEEEDEDGPLILGWTRYRVKNGLLIIDGEIPKREEEDYTAEEYHNDAIQNFTFLIKRWNNYKEEYDELNGDGAYDRLYSMPNYESVFYDDLDDY